ncbi:MAG: MbcA/ParS/Xre antitoxin family protein, partial [Patescibacteria group bacterium]
MKNHFPIPRTKKLADLTADDVPPGMDPEDVATDCQPEKTRGRSKQRRRAMANAKTDAEIKKELLDYFCDEENLRFWLNSPHPDLGYRTPQSLIDDGRGNIVLDMLENAKM